MSKEQNEIPTPENWHWAITPQQVTEIQQGNRDTINKVYFDNYEKFKNAVVAICSRRGKMSFFEDALQSLYLDLPFYDFKNLQRFYCCILDTCRFVFGYSHKCVNWATTVSLETPLDDTENLTLGDSIAVYDVDEIEIEEQNKRLLEIIDTQKHLTRRQKDVLVAIAFGCAPMEGLYERLQRQTR